VTVRGIFGDYFMLAPSGLFLKKNRFGKSSGNDASPGLHMMVGKRVVATVEMDEGDKFDAGLLKQITGGEAMTARPLYAPFFTFQPQCVPIFLTNFIPGTEDFSGAMQQRLRIVKFEHVFRHTKDEIKGLTEKLVDEYPGILNWALVGLKEYKAAGSLREPAAIITAVEEYMSEENLVARWLKTCTTPEKTLTPCKASYASFKQFAGDNGEFVMSNQRFGRRLKQLGYESKQFKIEGKNVKCYRGFELIDNEKPSVQTQTHLDDLDDSPFSE
jgi:putative DNA primase/helicase